MELEEAIERLKKYLIDIEKMGYRKLPNDEAISTVLQELEHLQKENEELKHAVVGIDLDNTYISKDEIRKMKANIQMIANGNKVIENTIKYRVQMALLDDLLKEE